MPRSRPEQAPKRVAFWLVGLKKQETLRPYASLEAVAARLQKTNPLLRGDRARWLAGHWSKRVPGENGAADGGEWLEFVKRITAPVLWIEGDRTDVGIGWGDRYTKAEFHERLNVVRQVERHIVAPAGHMLHHDRPEDVARLVESFLG